ncbi:MAG: phospholipase D-like domain-containing protein, partial [Gammaproteobacteria bacterium]
RAGLQSWVAGRRISRVEVLHPRAVRRQASDLQAMLVDRRVCWVGSFNFDPRSLLLNTEVGLLVESPELARRLVAVFAADTAPDRSWEVVRRVPGDVEGGLARLRWRLGWRGMQDGREILLEHEPAAGWWREWWVRLAARIPGLDQLL